MTQIWGNAEMILDNTVIKNIMRIGMLLQNWSTKYATKGCDTYVKKMAKHIFASGNTTHLASHGFPACTGSELYHGGLGRPAEQLEGFHLR